VQYITTRLCVAECRHHETYTRVTTDHITAHLILFLIVTLRTLIIHNTPARRGAITRKLSLITADNENKLIWRLLYYIGNTTEA